MTRLERVYGGMLGLALGDAISYPAAMHRGLQLHEWKRRFQRRTDLEMLDQGILRATVPFGFGSDDNLLLPGPTDDTEFAVFTAQVLIAHDSHPRPEDFVDAWRSRIVDQADQVWSGFSERAAIENFRRGMLPPTTGNDNPQFYDDSAIARAVPIGLAHAGEPEQAATLAAVDAAVTHAEEGVWAAQAMAAAVAVAASGGSLSDALAAGRARIPADSWLAWGDSRARQLVAGCTAPGDAALALSQALITRTYSYATAAAETLPAAFALAEATGGDLWQGVLFANTCARAADTLPPLVGALAGALQGPQTIPPAWIASLRTLRGVCIRDLAGVDLKQIVQGLAGSSI